MITQIDFKMLDFIQSLRTPLLDEFFSFITRLGDGGIIWILIAVGLFFLKKTRKISIMMAFTLIVGLLIGNITLKNFIARERPFIQNPGIQLIIATPGGYSFPSGHTLSSFETATVIFLNNKKWGTAALILAALIGFSRNYLYVHFPTDVLVGALLGIAIGIFVYLMYNKFIDPKIKIGKL